MDDRFDMPSASLKPAPLDREALEHILDLGGADLRSALCEQLISDFLRLRAAIADDDTARLARAAHELKGLAATIGADTVSDLASSLDQAAQGLTAETCAGMITPLHIQIDRVIAVLRGIRTA